MTRLLLDYRWELKEALQNTDASNAIREFVNLIRKTGLNPVPFVETHQQIELWQNSPDRIFNRQQIKIFLEICSRQNVSMCTAEPVPPPPGISNNWKRALRDNLNNPSDWRNPHIIVSEKRLTEWAPHKNEVAIQCEKCNDQPETGPHHRVLAVLERYEFHPFALSDLDPWDVRCTVPLGAHPCYLPNPLIPDGDPLQNNLRRVPVAQICDELDEARRRGWQVNGKSFFIPPPDWRPEDISQAAWREGRAFPRIYSQERQQVGYRDSVGRVWLWHKGRGGHKGEDHWDVQMGNSDYIKVRHTGEPI